MIQNKNARFQISVFLLFAFWIFACSQKTEKQECSQIVDSLCEPVKQDTIPNGLLAIISAYPDFNFKADSNHLIWPDGTTMIYDDGIKNKSFIEKLNNPCLKNQLEMKYINNEISLNPDTNYNPGRIRFLTFFMKMYGNNENEVCENLVEIAWMPKTIKKRLQVTKINGVDKKLRAISAALDTLPENLKKYVVKPGGTFKWRKIARSNNLSSHSFGIAIDINIDYSNYWLWDSVTFKGKYPYRNQIPIDIVRIFEDHGFIWGGRWYHFDTMHFEYRPELLVF